MELVKRIFTWVDKETKEEKFGSEYRLYLNEEHYIKIRPTEKDGYAVLNVFAKVIDGRKENKSSN